MVSYNRLLELKNVIKSIHVSTESGWNWFLHTPQILTSSEHPRLLVAHNEGNTVYSVTKGSFYAIKYTTNFLILIVCITSANVPTWLQQCSVDVAYQQYKASHVQGENTVWEIVTCRQRCFYVQVRSRDYARTMTQPQKVVPVQLTVYSNVKPIITRTAKGNCVKPLH